jgi:hypothetical protein
VLHPASQLDPAWGRFPADSTRERTVSGYPTDVAKIPFLMLPGSGFPRGGDGISESFLSDLDKAKFDPRIVSYPAQGFGKGQSYASSRDAGIDALFTAVAHATNKGVGRFAVGGYSQGAVAAGDFAEQWLATHRDNPTQRNRLAAVALIADGRRPADKGTPGRPLAPGYGIMGQRPIDLPTAFWAAAPGDPICALPAGNPLRTVADMIEWFAISRPEDVPRWGADLLDKALKRGYQPWWSIEYFRDWAGAAAFARGFLFDFRHTADYIRFGHNRDVANAINRHVT